MSDDSAAAEKTTAGIHEELKDFVERAMTDTPDLSAEQVRVIRERVFDWYVYYGRTLAWLPLDFADTEETRWMRRYFREALGAFVTGWNTLDHIYYAVEMVMIGFLKEHTRLALEDRLTSERNLPQQQPPTEAQGSSVAAFGGETLAPSAAVAAPTRKKSPGAAKKTTALSVPPPEQPAPDQFSLFA